MADEAVPKPQIILEVPDVDPAPEEYNLQGKIYNMVFSLGALIVGVMVVTFVIKKLTQKRREAANAAGSIKILEKRAINPKTYLYVVEVHNKTMLIGESGAGLVSLGELTPEEVVASPDPAPLSFTHILKRKFEELKS